MTTIYRQGDVMLVKVDALPEPIYATQEDKDAGRVAWPAQVDLSKQSRLVLAYGEVTGHAHAIERDPETKVLPVKAWDAGAERYIQVLEKTALTHEEHAPIPLDPGIYKVVRQREYDPAQLRYVAD